MHKRRAQTHKRRPKQGRRAQLPAKTKHSSSSHRTLITSDETDVRLRYRYTNSISGAGPLYVKAFTPNAAFDVDPALGSTETYGFDEYAALYSYYRVISYAYTVRVAANSLTASATNVYVLNTNTQISGSRFDLYSTNPYCTTKFLTAYGQGSSVVIKGRHNVSQIVGSRAPETDDNYRALTTAVPADLVWLTVAFESLAGANVALDVIVDISMTVRFYGREYDLSLSAMAARIQKSLVAREQYTLEKRLKSRTAPLVTNSKANENVSNKEAAYSGKNL